GAREPAARGADPGAGRGRPAARRAAAGGAGDRGGGGRALRRRRAGALLPLRHRRGRGGRALRGPGGRARDRTKSVIGPEDLTGLVASATIAAWPVKSSGPMT